MTSIEYKSEMSRMLTEAKRLHDIGLAVHWLKPNSKVPVKSGWTSSERYEWHQLRAEYRMGYGLGLRLGDASKIAGDYIAVFDIDLKSDLKRHAEEVRLQLARFVSDTSKYPLVKTGRGFHLYVSTSFPVISEKLVTSQEMTKVFMPDSPVNKTQEEAVKNGILTNAELVSGFRSRPAWQLEFMSLGKQVVLPPTIHQYTKKRYHWIRGISL